MKQSSGRKDHRRTKRHFSAEFKAEAVHLVRQRRAQGVSLRQVARELDVGAALLWEWARQLEGPGPVAAPNGDVETLEEEVKRLRREVAILRQERDFAKKAAAFFMKESL